MEFLFSGLYGKLHSAHFPVLLSQISWKEEILSLKGWVRQPLCFLNVSLWNIISTGFSGMNVYKNSKAKAHCTRLLQLAKWLKHLTTMTTIFCCVNIKEKDHNLSLSLALYCLLVKSESIPPSCVSFSLLNSVSSHSCVCWTSLIDPSKWLHIVPMQLSVLLAVFQPGRIQNGHLQRKLQIFQILVHTMTHIQTVCQWQPCLNSSKVFPNITQTHFSKLFHNSRNIPHDIFIGLHIVCKIVWRQQLRHQLITNNCFCLNAKKSLCTSQNNHFYVMDHRWLHEL